VLSNRPLNVLFALLSLSFSNLLAGVSIAQTAQQKKTCANVSADAFERISACSAFIQTQRLPSGVTIPTKELAQVYVNRAIAYEAVSAYERAIADYEKATPFFPANQANIDRARVELRWLQYLGEIQNDQDFANWAGPPLEAFWSAK
jgi:tetratricopeptide (TPR) repeat protein